jgi:hypothetical protein
MHLTSGLACLLEFCSIKYVYCFLFKYLSIVFNAIILQAGIKQMFPVKLSLKHEFCVR